MSSGDLVSAGTVLEADESEALVSEFDFERAKVLKGRKRKRTQRSQRGTHFHCYVLRSLVRCASGKRSGRSYVGFTTHPKRRIRQHNGEIKGGARVTRSYRPWVMALVVEGFPSKNAALSFEWHMHQIHRPRRSKLLRQAFVSGKAKGRKALTADDKVTAAVSGAASAAGTSVGANEKQALHEEAWLEEVDGEGCAFGAIDEDEDGSVLFEAWSAKEKEEEEKKKKLKSKKQQKQEAQRLRKIARAAKARAKAAALAKEEARASPECTGVPAGKTFSGRGFAGRMNAAHFLSLCRPFREYGLRFVYNSPTVRKETHALLLDLCGALEKGQSTHGGEVGGVSTPASSSSSVAAAVATAAASTSGARGLLRPHVCGELDLLDLYAEGVEKSGAKEDRGKADKKKEGEGEEEEEREKEKAQGAQFEGAGKENATSSAANVASDESWSFLHEEFAGLEIGDDGIENGGGAVASATLCRHITISDSDSDDEDRRGQKKEAEEGQGDNDGDGNDDDDDDDDDGDGDDNICILIDDGDEEDESEDENQASGIITLFSDSSALSSSSDLELDEDDETNYDRDEGKEDDIEDDIGAIDLTKHTSL